MKIDLLLHHETLAAVEAYLRKPTQGLLLVGNSGNGKTVMVRQLAAELLGITAEKLEQHPYVKILQPLDGKITIEQVRSLTTFVQLAVPSSHEVARLLCIYDADAMTREAQNALLKLLEEPPEQTMIILTSSSPRQLLPTIRSRLQTLRVQLPDEAQIVEYFVQQGHATDAVKKAFVVANGSVAVLKTTLEQQDEAETMLDAVKRVFAADTFTRLALVETELKDKVKARAFVDALVVTASASLPGAKQIGRWQQILQAAVTAQKALAQNGNQKLVLTELMLSL